MNEDRMMGAAERIGGQAKGMAGDAVGSDRLRAEGTMDDLQGQARQALGQAKEMVQDAAEGARRWVEQRAPERVGGDEVREVLADAGRQTLNFVRERPLMALGIIAAFAFVLGRSNRGDSRHRTGMWR